MSIFDEDPIIKSNNEKFYILLKSIKKKDSFSKVLEYLDSIDNNIDLHYSFSRKSTYSDKIFKHLESRPEHLKLLILYSVNKEIKNSFYTYLCYMRFPKNNKHYDEFVKFAFETPECYNLTKNNYHFWENYIIENFEVENSFIDSILKHYKRKDSSKNNNFISSGYNRHSDFSSVYVFNKMLQLYGTEKYASLLNFLHKEQFDFSLSTVKFNEQYNKNRDAPYINFYYCHYNKDSIPKKVINDYLSFLDIQSFPENYQKAFLQEVLSFRSFYSSQSCELSTAFFEKNKKFTINADFNYSSMSSVYSDFFAYAIENDIPLNLLENVIIIEKHKSYSSHYSTASSFEEKITLNETNLLEKIIHNYYDNKTSHYNTSKDDILTYMVNHISDFGKQTALLIEKLIENNVTSFFDKIASEKMNEFNNILLNNNNLISFVNSLKLKLNQNIVPRDPFNQAYKKIISKINIDGLQDVDFKMLQLEQTSFQKKEIFFDLIFENNEKLGHLIFDYYEKSISSQSFYGFKNIEFYEHYLNKPYFKKYENLLKMKSFITFLFNTKNISSNEKDFLTTVSEKISKQEKNILIDALQSKDGSDFDIKRKRI